MNNISEAQKKKLDFYNSLKSQTVEQKEAIELKKIQKCKMKRKHIIDNIKKKERTIFINHLYKRLKVSEITEDIAEKEQLFFN